MPPFYERVTEIAEGNPGNLVTLSRLRFLIRSAPPSLGFMAHEVQASAASQADQVSMLFRWVQRHMRYIHPDPDPNTQVLQTPELLLSTIMRTGYARGICGDYVSLLGAFLYALGIPIRLVGVAVARDDRVWDHLYLAAMLDGARVPLDPIPTVPWPMGEEIPAAEVTSRIEVAV